jgi:hypothetical protein
MHSKGQWHPEACQGRSSLPGLFAIGSQLVSALFAPWEAYTINIHRIGRRFLNASVQCFACPSPLGRFRVPTEVGYEKLLFNFILDSPKPLFRASCSLSPMLNLSFHFVGSVFGRSELHGKLMCKTHGAIAIFFRKVGRRSNLSDDGFPCVIYLRDFILRFFFGHKFEHLFGCVIGTLIHD